MAGIRIAGLIIALSMVTVPATADGEWTDFTATAAVPCAATCPYWLDEANTDVDDDGTEDVYFNACSAPGPTVSFDDILTAAAPDGVNALRVELTPSGSRDLFVCDPATGESLDDGVCACDIPDCATTPGVVGCASSVTLPVVAGDTVLIRVFNWMDAVPAPGRYRFLRI